jgi:hypothetical protein
VTPDWYRGITDLVFLVGVLAFFAGMVFVAVRGFLRGYRRK